jgi:hypothetical protein
LADALHRLAQEPPDHEEDQDLSKKDDLGPSAALLQALGEGRGGARDREAKRAAAGRRQSTGRP